MTEKTPDAPIKVRPAIPADAGEIARVHVASWQSTYRGIVPQPILDGLSIERRAEFWERLLREPGENRTWVGEMDGVIVGFAGTSRTTEPDLVSGIGELESIYLLPRAKGVGLGRLLLRAATRDFMERGLTSAILWVFTANERARRFYEAAGWGLDGAAQTHDFGGTAVEAIRYRIDLPGSTPSST